MISSDIQSQDNLGEDPCMCSGQDTSVGNNHFSALIHLFLFKKVSLIAAPEDGAGFVDVILATHQHYNDQLRLQPLPQPSLARLKTFFIYLLRDEVKRKAKASQGTLPQASSTTRFQ